MSISKKAVKLAAVTALAVAGVAGSVWAALLQDTGKMSVTYGVGDVAEIVCISKTLTEEGLTANDLGNVSVTDVQMKDPGTLGQIKVTTNSAEWDILMSTLYGGRLVYKTDGGDLNALIYATDNSTTASGLIGGNIIDTVQLEVAIGVGKIGAELPPGALEAGTVYMYGAPVEANILAPIKIGFAVLDSSRSKEIMDGTDHTPEKISFATILSDGYGTMADPKPEVLDKRTWTAIGTSGFGVPTYKAKGPTSRGSDAYFFVNVGFAPGSVIKFGNNTKGVYTEEFTFELAANF